jgi:hypothetical protein
MFRISAVIDNSPCVGSYIPPRVVWNFKLSGDSPNILVIPVS